MKAVISYYSILFSQKFILCEAITCSRLSDSGEDAKGKGTRKGGSGGKRKYFPLALCSCSCFLKYADWTISETGSEVRAV